MKKYLILIGWAILPIAFSARFNHMIDGTMVLPMVSSVVLTPLMEELIKFLAYLGMSKKNTILVPIAMVVYEAIQTSVNPFTGAIDGFTYLAQVASNVFLLKHILFWVPAKLFNFKWYAYPIMVTLHSIWNLYYLFVSPPDDAFLSGVLAIAMLGLAFVLFREQKGE